jgi:hypothetical protein
MTLESLETLNDEQLQAVIARAGELLTQHDRDRKVKALAEARSILASAGLNLKNVTEKGKAAKPAKTNARSQRTSMPGST